MSPCLLHGLRLGRWWECLRVPRGGYFHRRQLMREFRLRILELSLEGPAGRLTYPLDRI
jgi:hypothetical protein